MSGKVQKDSDNRLRVIDLIVILLCLSGAVISINLFRLDLFRSLNAMNETPVGTIILKNNIVQRRMANRVLWDRLLVDSPAYSGDLVRTADLSSATLLLGNNNVEMGENTLIRIIRSADGDASVQIELDEGAVSLNSGLEGGGSIVLLHRGQQVHLGSGSSVRVSSGVDGMTLSVERGNAAVVESGGRRQRREISSGSVVSIDNAGQDRSVRTVMITQPGSNARYLKNTGEAVNVDFAWNRTNFGQGETLVLEIAGDRRFNRVVHRMENLETSASVPLDAGLWYWRLSSAQSAETLSSGNITVTENAGVRLLNPVGDSLVVYNDTLPQVRFQWSSVDDALNYILEVSASQNLSNSQITRQTSSVFLIDSTLGEGTWYWRVTPVFPQAYNVRGGFSAVSSFRIEQQGRAVVPSIPEPVETAPVISQTETAAAVPSTPPAPTSSTTQTTPQTAAPTVTVPSIPEPVETAPPTSQTETAASTSTTPSQPETVETVPETLAPSIPEPETVPASPQPETVVSVPAIPQVETTTPAETAETVPPTPQIPSQTTPQPETQTEAYEVLSAPRNLRPSNEYVIGIEQLRESSEIVFTWSTVRGANAYIFTLYEQTANGQREILRTSPSSGTRRTFDITTLEPGIFLWQVEAVYINPAGVIEQKGRKGESSFIIDIPLPGRVRIENPGILYGN